MFFPRIYLHYLFLRVRYGIDISDYFDNQLWNRTVNHEDFYGQLHTYIHKWSYASRHYSPSQGKWWLMFHYFDYLVSKLYCPGLDAMDYFRCQFYNFLPSKRNTFITEGQLCKMVDKLNGSPDGIKLAKIFRSKAAFNKLFSDVVGRSWILVDASTKTEFEDFCNVHHKVIGKPSEGRLSEKSSISSVRIENPLLALYRCTEYFGLARTFRTVWGGDEAPGGFGMRSLISVPASRSFKRCFEQGLRTCI